MRQFNRNAILESVSMKELLEYHGITFNRSGRFSCIDPDHIDSDPSCHILPGDKKCYCHSCHKTFDVFTAQMALTNENWQEAGFALSEMFGIPLLDGDVPFIETEKLLSSEDQALLGLSPHSSQSVGVVTGISQERTSDAFHFDEELDAYLVCEKPKMSLRKLLQEDKEAYYALVTNKASEAYSKNKKAYNALHRPDGSEFSNKLCGIVSEFPIDNPIYMMENVYQERMSRCEELYDEYKEKYYGVSQ